ncbi:MAG: tetratricopeptide repeat protein, partial [Acidobacteriia bacterium]|nr:tetratricopeptide repeat protein [Terriglobia bacterium]
MSRQTTKSRLVRCVALFVGLGYAAGMSFAGQQPPGKSPERIFQVAQQNLQAGSYSEAEKGFREVLRLDPRSAAAYANLGVVYLRTNRFQDAVESFQEATRLAPNVAGLYLNLGLAYLNLGKYPEAIPPFRRALDLA